MRIRILLICSYIFIVNATSAQSKKELAKSITALESKVELLTAKSELLQIENKQLREQMNNMMSLIIEMNKSQAKQSTSNQVVPSVPDSRTNSNSNSSKIEQSKPVSVSRCQATTKKGNQCSRNAQPGRSYCWQH